MLPELNHIQHQKVELYLWTEANQNNQKFTDKVITRVPMRRWGDPEDFSGIAVYLASDSSSYHSGDMFIVDGGYAIF